MSVPATVKALEKAAAPETANVSDKVTPELKVVASATLPPVKEEPEPTAEPSHVRVPLSFVRAVSPMYSALETVKSFKTVTVPEV